MLKIDLVEGLANKNDKSIKSKYTKRLAKVLFGITDNSYYERFLYY